MAGTQIYGQLIRAQLENSTSDLSPAATGLHYYNTSTNVVKWYTGSVWKTAVDTDSTQTLSAKTLSSCTINGGSNTISNINLTSQVTGVLPAANGGTGVNSTATFPSSGVVDTTTATVTLQNKTLDNTNSANFFDASLTVQDSTGGATGKFRFDASTITTGTTRVFAVPNTSTTLVGTAATQTLTNKTISGANNTISNINLASQVTGTLPVGSGGTGQITASAAFDALSPMNALGDLIRGGTAGANTRLGIGSTGQILTVVGGIPAWASPTPNLSRSTSNTGLSVSTNVRNFVKANNTTVGSDITYTADIDNGGNGDKWTINTAGTYAITYADSNTAAVKSFGITLNSTANPETLTTVNNLVMTSSPNNDFNSCHVVWNFAVNDVIRANTATNTNWSTSARVIFRIVRLS